MQFNIGEILDRVCSIWFRNLLSLTLVSAVLHSPLLVLAIVCDELGYFESGPLDSEFLDTYNVLSFPLHLFLWSVMIAALTHGVIEALRGRNIEVSDCLAKGLRVMFPVLVLSFAMGIATMLGCCLCIVPGVLFHLVFYVTIPVLVIERAGIIGSLERSAGLTQGFRLPILAVVLVITVALGFVNTLLSIPVFLGMDPLMTVLIQLGGLTLTSPFATATTAVVYHTLKQIKEGLGEDDVSEVFG